VRSSHQTVAKALEGDYRSEHLFALRQSLAGYRYYQKLIADVDQEMGRYIADLRTGSEPDSRLPPQTKKTKYRRQHHEPASLDLRSELYRVFGVDLTDVPGISSVTAHTILCEVGTDLTRFRNASAFASWLGLCPEKQISGGKVLYTKSRRVKSRLATALRIGLIPCITLTTIWASSSAALRAGSEKHRRLRLLRISSLESSSIC
jgi:transposase